MGLILASSSPRRKRILEDLGYTFQCISPDIDESNDGDLDSTSYVVRMSENKARHVWENNQDCYIL